MDNIKLDNLISTFLKKYNSLAQKAEKSKEYDYKLNREIIKLNIVYGDKIFKKFWKEFDLEKSNYEFKDTIMQLKTHRKNIEYLYFDNILYHNLVNKILEKIYTHKLSPYNGIDLNRMIMNGWYDITLNRYKFDNYTLPRFKVETNMTKEIVDKIIDTNDTDNKSYCGIDVNILKNRSKRMLIKYGIYEKKFIEYVEEFIKLDDMKIFQI